MIINRGYTVFNWHIAMKYKPSVSLKSTENTAPYFFFVTRKSNELEGKKCCSYVMYKTLKLSRLLVEDLSREYILVYTHFANN